MPIRSSMHSCIGVPATSLPPEALTWTVRPTATLWVLTPTSTIDLAEAVPAPSARPAAATATTAAAEPVLPRTMLLMVPMRLPLW